MPIMFLEENLENEFILIKNMKQIKCNILENGLKPIHMKYYFCSCDPNKIDPICEECALKCHANAKHSLSTPLEGPNVCACGLRGHNVTNDAPNMIKYNKVCPFFDFANISGKLIYYINEQNEKLCMFCNVFCIKYENRENSLNNFPEISLEIKQNQDYAEKHNNKNIKKFTKKNQDNEIHFNSELDRCECSHENHSNIKTILQLTNNIGNHREKFENLSSNQLLNIIFKINI